MSDAREHHLPITRTARFVVAGDPAVAPELWFVLHGYRQLAGRFIRRFEGMPGIQERKRAVIAPEALSRFYIEREPTGPHTSESRVGASWMTRADREHEIADYVDYLDRLRHHVGGAAERIVVLGFSQGAETASRWAVLGAAPPDELILWGGGLAEDLEGERISMALAGTRITFVAGLEDSWARARSEAGMEVLREQGVAARRRDYPGGHRVEAAVLAAEWPLLE